MNRFDLVVKLREFANNKRNTNGQRTLALYFAEWISYPMLVGELNDLDDMVSLPSLFARAYDDLRYCDYSAARVKYYLEEGWDLSWVDSGKTAFSVSRIVFHVTGSSYAQQAVERLLGADCAMLELAANQFVQRVYTNGGMYRHATSGPRDYTMKGVFGDTTLRVWNRDTGNILLALARPLFQCKEESVRLSLGHGGIYPTSVHVQAMCSLEAALSMFHAVETHWPDRFEQQERKLLVDCSYPISR